MKMYARTIPAKHNWDLQSDLRLYKSRSTAEREYTRGRTAVATAPMKYNTSPIAAITPITGTKTPTRRPAAPVALAAPSQRHHEGVRRNRPRAARPTWRGRERSRPRSPPMRPNGQWRRRRRQTSQSSFLSGWGVQPTRGKQHDTYRVVGRYAPPRAKSTRHVSFPIRCRHGDA
jgi:hypothetical protein